jgi:SEC-C motif-containing protein
MCYCTLPEPFEQCCAPFINGTQHPTTAEQLMRSRYSAYCQKNAEYIRATYASSQQQYHSIEDILLFAQSVQFINLEIITTSETLEDNYVEFKATYIADNKICMLHEKSRFIKESEHWKYLDGDIYPTPELKLGRNDNCPCGSGKKFKKCHAS